MKAFKAKSKEGTEVMRNRVLNTDFFLYLFDHEVKRARRYQNFLSILILKLAALSKDDGGDLQTSYMMLTNLLAEEIRETDIIGHIAKNTVAVILPYADFSAGNKAKSRVEEILKCCDFKSRGYDVNINQIFFPMNGTETMDLIKKAIATEVS